MVFNSHFPRSFNNILEVVGSIEFELVKFHAAIVKAAAQSCGSKVAGTVGCGRSLVRPWNKTPRPRNSGQLFGGSGGKSETLSCPVFSVGGKLLTSTDSIVRQWKEYFEDFLNPTNTHSEEEAELEDSGLGSPITEAEVAGDG